MAQERIDLKPTYEMMGLAAGVSAVAGAGTTLTLSGLFNLRGRRFFGGLFLLAISLTVGKLFAEVDKEMCEQAERDPLMREVHSTSDLSAMRARSPA